MLIEERKNQTEMVFKLIVISICAYLYSHGGMEQKWLRRFLAPGVCGVSLLYFTKDWKALIVTPLLIWSSCLGYGASDMWLKVLKRSYVGLAFGFSASSYNIIRREWLIVGFIAIVITSAYIVFGVFNPLSARGEETLLGFLIYGFCIICAERKK